MNDRPRRYRVSVVVCTRNRCGLLARCLESLVGQDLPPDEFEIIVVDNGSRDATRETVERCRERAPRHSVTFIREESPGLSRGKNRGIAEARGGIVAFTDDDVVADRGWLRELLEVHASRRADIVGGRVSLDYTLPRPSWLDDDMEAWLSKLDLGRRIRRIRYPEELLGANLSFRASCLAKMGGFDTRLGRNDCSLLSGEDTELVWRMARCGAKACYAPDARVWHLVEPERLTRGWFLKRAYHGGRSILRVNVMVEGRLEALRQMRVTARTLLKAPLIKKRGLFAGCLTLMKLLGFLRDSRHIFFPSGLFFREWREARRSKARRARFYRPEEAEGTIAAGLKADIDGILFLGHALEGRSLRLFFRAESRIRKRYIIFVHVYPENADMLGEERRPHGFFNLDHAPAVPTTRWKMGRVFIDEVDLRRLPAGRYTVRFGLLDEKSGERGRVAGTTDKELEIGGVVLAEVTG